MSKEMRRLIDTFNQHMLNESKQYRVFRAPVGTPRKVEIDGKPELWCMLGPLPDNVIKYIKKNLKPVVHPTTGEFVLNPETKEPYIKEIGGKNKGDYYFFDETTGNWWMAHERFQGKAIILSPDEWNEIFESG